MSTYSEADLSDFPGPLELLSSTAGIQWCLTMWVLLFPVCVSQQKWPQVPLAKAGAKVLTSDSIIRLFLRDVWFPYVGGYERPFAQIKVWLFIFQYTFLRCSSLVQKPPISKISWMWTSNFICFCISAEEVIQFCKELIILLFLPIQLTLTKIFAIS